MWDYIAEHDLPYNPLHDQGYASIGCTHCTLPGDGPRRAAGPGSRRPSAGCTRPSRADSAPRRTRSRRRPSAISSGGCVGEREPQRRAVGRAGEEREAGHEGDVARERALEQRRGVAAVGQPRPDEHAAVGVVVRRARRQRGRQPVDERVAARAVGGAQAPMRASRSTVASQRAAAAWSTVDECRSAACLAIVSGRRSAARAPRTQPTRSPGAAIFDSVDSDSTRSSRAGQRGQRRQRRRRGSAARRTGRPRRSTGRRGARARRAPRAARAAACGPSGSGTSGST